MLVLKSLSSSAMSLRLQWECVVDFSVVGSKLHLGRKSRIATGPMPPTQPMLEGAWEVVRPTISISFVI